MKSYIIKFLLLLTLSKCYSQNDRIINLDILNCKDSTMVSIISFNVIENDCIFSEKVINNKCSFKFPISFNDGVYEIRINYPYLNYETTNVSSFYIVVDHSESEISIVYDFKSKDLPFFTDSKINQNWYSYLTEEKKLHIILKNTLKNDNYKIVEIKNQIQRIKDFFLSQNYNFWTSSMVKYSSFDFYSDDNFSNENEFWDTIETNNPSLINSPIYQNIIQKYSILFNRDKSNATSYVFVYENIIKRFSKNLTVKAWVIKYIKYGVNQTKNKELIDYFSKID